MKGPDSPNKFGIFNVASVTPRVAIADPARNIDYIIEELERPEIRRAQLVVFPELSVSGYTCGDLFFQSTLISQCEQELARLANYLKNDDRLVAAGLPVEFGGRLYNCATILANGRILGIVPKVNIPNYQEFYEKRWFHSGRHISNREICFAGQEVPFGRNLLFSHKGVTAGVEICEDLWVPNPPSSELCMAGAQIILNLSATDDNIGKYAYIRSLVSSQSGRGRCVYVYSSAGRGESSTDLVFSGINLIANDGTIVAGSERFSAEYSFAVAAVYIEKLKNDRRKYSSFFSGETSEEETGYQVISGDAPAPEKGFEFPVKVNPAPFVPDTSIRNESCKEIVSIQSWGLHQRLDSTGCRHLVVGISGGLDSTLALLIAHNTFAKAGWDPKGIVGVTMPSVATSSRTYTNSLNLMRRLGVTALEIPIKGAVDLHFSDIGHDPKVHDAVYENSQARERTQILMDLANKYGGMVLGTGDMSELALGWCTYNGDHMSMYNVNAGVPKTLVKYLVGWFADSTNDRELQSVLQDIIDTPISPELIPADEGDTIGQFTENIVGPYELHDFFLYHVLRNCFAPGKIFYLAKLAFDGKYTDETIKKWLVNFYRRFFSQQFKRSCMPDGPKIGSVCLSPRGDWRMPSDAKASIWLHEIENL